MKPLVLIGLIATAAGSLMTFVLGSNYSVCQQWYVDNSQQACVQAGIAHHLGITVIIAGVLLAAIGVAGVAVENRPEGRHEHSPVIVNQPFRHGFNRYKLACGYWIDCKYTHPIGSFADCVFHGVRERVVWSATTEQTHSAPAHHAAQDVMATYRRAETVLAETLPVVRDLAERGKR